MQKLMMVALVVLALGVACATPTLGQGADRPPGLTTDDCSKQVLAELRRTREVIEQLKRELIQLQVVTIRMRLQQDVVATKDARLDSVRSEIQTQNEVLAQLRERAKRLEALDAPQAEGDRERAQAEREEVKRELEREDDKLAGLRNQETQLTAELQAERARLNDLLMGIEILGSDSTTGAFNRPAGTRDATGQPNN
jgi:chromosome segregation ATPase